MTRPRLLATAALALLLGACFDPPVEEAVHIELLPTGGALVRATVAIDPGDQAENNAALARRVEELRRALTNGYDEWTPRFEALTAREEEMRWRLVEGAITLFERSATIEDPAELDRFFADVGVFHTVEAGTAELALYPGVAGRATRRERRRVEEALSEWSGRVAGYLAAARDLWEYLDLYPGRAAPAFADLFGDLVAEGTAERWAPLSDEEERLVESLEEAMSGVWEVLLIDSGEAYSINELSRRVYDPFPARITLRPPFAPIEHEGFEPAGDEVWAIRPLSLWGALERLEDRFLTPDPLMIWVRHTRSGAEIDVEALAARPRRVEALVTASELETELADGLRPAEAYRLRWPVGASAAPQ